MTLSIPQLIWEPTAEEVAAARVTGFIQTVNDRTGLALSRYDQTCGPTPPKISPASGRPSPSISTSAGTSHRRRCWTIRRCPALDGSRTPP